MAITRKNSNSNSNSKLNSSLFFSILMLLLSSSVAYDTDSLIQFKKSLTFGNGVDSLVTWQATSAPCLSNPPWNGVVCYEGIVTGLRLQGMELGGKIDVTALSSLPALRTLSFDSNNFTGPLPEFNRLGALKALYLSNNQFSGEIPADYFSKMESLKKLYIRNNKFTGEIPSSLAQLRYLIELHVENNQFTGRIPPLKQPPLMDLNMSNNKLEGEIPVGLSKFNSSSFDSNPELCGKTMGKDCNQSNNAIDSLPETSEKKNNSGTVVAVMGSAVAIAVLIIVILILGSKRKERELNTIGEDPKRSSINDGAAEAEVGVGVATTLSRKGSSTTSKLSASSKKGSSHGGGGGGEMGDLVVVNGEKGVFGMADLMKAAAEVLGNGGAGSAYKAVMASGVAVVVKRMKEMSRLENEGFEAEIRRLAAVRHGNVLPPLAYHYRKEEKLVVSEFVPKGSLLYLLHGDWGTSHAELNWPTRLKIIKGIAQGLAYLHSTLDMYDLPHGNLKSSNILINEDNEPLLSDYGFSPLTNPNAAAQALFGYRAPEAIQNRAVVTPKCDIYCLGVVILEIVTGKFPSQYLPNSKGGTDVVQWAVSAISENKEVDLIDPEIITSSTTKYNKDMMVEVLHIAVSCTEPNPEARPSIQKVIERIQSVQDEALGQEAYRSIQVLPSLRDGIC